MMAHDCQEVASFSITKGINYSDSALKIIISNKDVSSKFTKQDNDYVSLINKKHGQTTYSFIAFCDSLAAKEFSFDMIEKLSNYLMTELDQESKKITEQLTFTMSKKIKDFIETANQQIKGEKLSSINNELDQATESAKNGLNKILYQGIQ